MFLRFRQRRALRAMERNKKLQQTSKRSETTSSRPIDTIFRSVNSTTTFQNIPSVRTTGSSFDRDDLVSVEESQTVPSATSPSTPPVASPCQTTTSISCTTFAKGILVDGDVDINKHDETQKESLVVDTTNPQILQRMISLSVDYTNDIGTTAQRHHKRSSSCTNSGSTTKENLRNVLDEIQNEIFVSDQMKEELFITQIQLAFFKESYIEIDMELQKKDKVIQRQKLELLLGRKVVAYHKDEVSATKISFQESVVSLVDMKITLLSLQEQLNQQKSELQAMKLNFNTSLVT